MNGIYKLLKWIDKDKIHWFYLSENKHAIHILKQNEHKIIWNYLSGNPNAIDILEQNLDKISWYIICKSKLGSKK